MAKVSEDMDNLRERVKEMSKVKRRHNVLVCTNQPHRIFDAFNTYYKFSEYTDKTMPISLVVGLEHKPAVMKRMMDKNEDLIQIFIVSPDFVDDTNVHKSLNSRCTHNFSFIY